MTHMNAGIREAMIEKALVTSGINERRLVLTQDRANFAEKVRQVLLGLGDVTDAILDERKALIEKWNNHEYNIQYINLYGSSKQSHLDVNLNGMAVDLCFNGASARNGDTPLGKSAEFKRWVSYSRKNIADAALADEFMSLEKRAEDLKGEEQTLRATLTAATKRFRTIEKMKEEWPASAELLPDDLPVVQTGTGVALAVDDLNAICGIPKDKA